MTSSPQANLHRSRIGLVVGFSLIEETIHDLGAALAAANDPRRKLRLLELKVALCCAQVQAAARLTKSAVAECQAQATQRPPCPVPPEREPPLSDDGTGRLADANPRARLASSRTGRP